MRTYRQRFEEAQLSGLRKVLIHRGERQQFVEKLTELYVDENSTKDIYHFAGTLLTQLNLLKAEGSTGSPVDPILGEQATPIFDTEPFITTAVYASSTDSVQARDDALMDSVFDRIARTLTNLMDPLTLERRADLDESIIPLLDWYHNLALKQICDSVKNELKPNLVELQNYFDELSQQFERLVAEHDVLLQQTRLKGTFVFSSQKASDLQSAIDNQLLQVDRSLQIQQQEYRQVILSSPAMEHRQEYFFSSEAFNDTRLKASSSFTFRRPVSLHYPLETINHKIGEFATSVAQMKFKMLNGLSDQHFIATLGEALRSEGFDDHMDAFFKLENMLFPAKDKSNLKPVHVSLVPERMRNALPKFSKQIQIDLPSIPRPDFLEVKPPYCFTFITEVRSHYYKLPKKDLSKLSKETFNDFFRDHYNLTQFNQPVLDTISEVFKLEAAIAILTQQRDLMLRHQESNNAALRNAGEAFNAYESKRQQYTQQRIEVNNNNLALAFIQKVRDLEGKVSQTQGELRSSTESIATVTINQYDFRTPSGAPLSDCIKASLSQKTSDCHQLLQQITPINREVEAHNTVVTVLASINRETAVLTQFHTQLDNLIAQGEFPLKELEERMAALEDNMRKVQLDRDLSSFGYANANLVEALQQSQIALKLAHQKATLLIQESAALMDLAIRRSTNAKIDFFIEKINEVESIMNVRSLHRNEVVQKHLLEIRNVLQQNRIIFSELANNRSRNYEDVQMKVAQLLGMDLTFKSYLVVKINQFQFNQVGATPWRLWYESNWCKIKAWIINMFSHYDELEHLPRRIKTTYMLNRADNQVVNVKLPERFFYSRRRRFEGYDDSLSSPRSLFSSP